jgi:hypothetical protein
MKRILAPSVARCRPHLNLGPQHYTMREHVIHRVLRPSANGHLRHHGAHENLGGNFMNRRIALAITAICLSALACSVNPFRKPTATPQPPAAPIIVVPPASTDTPPAAVTATAAATQTLASTAIVTCPKGTTLNPSLNACFFASRTPKPLPCDTWKSPIDCALHACTWTKKTGLCSK